MPEKARQDLIQIARNNSGCSQLDTAVLLGQDYSVALDTIRCKDTWKGKPQRFDSIYPHVCFVPLQDFGVRQLAIMRLPDWREQILDLLFDEDTRSDNKGAFEYDALEDNTYLAFCKAAFRLLLNTMIYPSTRSNRSLK